MSDDDERMERANRIRRMREGQRSGDDGEVSDDEVSDDEGSDDPDTAEDADSNADTADDTTIETNDADEDGTTRTETGADAPPNEAETVASPATDDTEEPTATEQAIELSEDTDDQQADPTEQQARADGSEQPEEDSMNESSSTSDTEASSETDDTPDPQAIAQRAAQAASEVAGSGSETATDAVGSSASEPAGDDAPAGATTAAMQGATGVELPDQEEIDAAIEAAGGSVETADAAGLDDDATERGPGTVNATTTAEDTTRVLEFTLGDEHYCIDISLVEEIVKRDSITRVPNTDEYIEGVVDLRGQITTILDPKELMDIDAEGSETLMIVFDPDAFDDQGALGWIVDEVRQVAPIVESEVNQPPVDEDYIRGVVDREDSEEFVIWTKPEVAITLATIDETED